MAQTNRTELLFLKIFKAVVLIIMALSLLTALGGLAFAAYQFTRSPEPPAPARPAPAPRVDQADLLKELLPTPAQPQTEAPAATQPPSKNQPEKPAVGEPPSYDKEMADIYACFLEAGQAAGVTQPESDEHLKRLQKGIQRVANAKDKSRGQAYVDDAQRVVCQVMREPSVRAEMTSTKRSSELFFKSLNLHIKAWDQRVEASAAFVDREQSRIKADRARAARETRQAKAMVEPILMVAAGAFALFMVLAMYLILAAVEGHLRQLSLNTANSNNQAD